MGMDFAASGGSFGHGLRRSGNVRPGQECTRPRCLFRTDYPPAAWWRFASNGRMRRFSRNLLTFQVQPVRECKGYTYVGKHSVQEQYVDLPSGRTFVRTVGSGSPALVIHGGPGLEHSYLSEGLDFLAKMGRKLYFYDQLGAGGSRADSGLVNAVVLSAQLREMFNWVARQNEGAIEILAHSWGTHLFLRTFRSRPEGLADKLVFISPMGLTARQQMEALNTVWAKIPAGIMDQIEKASSAREGIKFLRLVTPYFLSSPDSKVTVAFSDYNLALGTAIIKELGDYDVTEVARDYRNAAVILGQQDYVRQAAEDSMPKECQIHVIPRSGHFSFAEQPRAFEQVVRAHLTGPR